MATTTLYRSGTLIARSPVLASRVVEPSLLLHPSDASRLQIAAGDRVTVQLNGEQLSLLAQVDEEAGVARLALARGVALPVPMATLDVRHVEKELELQEELS
jgi:NADH-quinone oxidoreductase subunit G